MDKFVLLALADHADHEGEHVHPGHELLVEKTGLSEATISKKIQKFIRNGWIQIDGNAKGGRGNRREYSIDVKAPPRNPYFIERERQKAERKAAKALEIQPLKTPSQVQPFRDENPLPDLTFGEEKGTSKFNLSEELKVELDAERLNLTQEKVELDTSAPIRNARVEPSVEPSIEPSVVERPNVRANGNQEPLENFSDAFRINSQGVATESITDQPTWSRLEAELAAACLWDWATATDVRKAIIAKTANKLLAAYPEPELGVIRQARKYYQINGKLKFQPGWIVEDYLLIREWCVRMKLVELTPAATNGHAPSLSAAEDEANARSWIATIDGYFANGMPPATTLDYLREVQAMFAGNAARTPGDDRVLARLNEVLEQTQRAA